MPITPKFNTSPLFCPLYHFLSHPSFCLSLRMKPPFFFLSSLVMFALLSLAYTDEKPIEGDEHPPMNCFPTNCGNVTDITYPFWVENKQPSHCGYPAFMLTCIDHILMLQLSSETFLVKKIFYENQSIVLADAKFINNQCPVQYSNISFNRTPFSVCSINKQLTFVFNCSETLPGYFEVDCAAIGKSNLTFAHFGDQLGLSSSCVTAVMPVLDYLGVGVEDYWRLFENGFLVNWTVADCTDCLQSRGQCGYNNESDNFMCICHDRAHSRQCHSGNTASSISSSSIGTNKREIIGIVGGVAGGFILLGILVIFCYKRKKRYLQSGLSGLLSWSSSKKSSKKDVEVGESNYHTHIFSYDELEEATSGFNASEELGDGGFGTVYKGKLRDGRTVAVKRLYEHNYRRLEQFMNEVEILSRLRHQNLVTLYGCTSRHSRELLLVYEYIPNGTVADHLHGSLASKASLTWPIRLSIAIETADALAYLHHAEPQIIHRDVKTNNILLDNHHHVKVADFGLSRLFPLDATHVSTAPQGTPGYVDPEYHQCYQLTDKSDVYSFGVVLIELISSKPAVDISRHRHEINLANLAVNKIQNCQLDQLVDTNLGYDVDLEVKRMIDQVAELAFRCLQSDGEMRPGIREVLEMLRVIGNGGYNEEGEGDGSEVMTKEESTFVKSGVPVSPDTVTGRWASRTSTPNTST